MSDQTKMTCFYFRLKTLEPEVINCQNRTRFRRVLYLQEVMSDLQLATRSSVAIAFEELNDERSVTTVFRAWNTVSTFLHQTTHRQSRLGSK